MATYPHSPETLGVTFDNQEVTELLQLLEHALGETRVEVHRTHTPDYRAQVQQREVILRGMIEKLKKPGS
jgi:hypothetical protein